MKKVLAVSLAILMLISTFPVVNVFAANDEMIIVVEAPDDYASVVMPENADENVDWDGLVETIRNAIITQTTYVDIRSFSLAYNDDNTAYLRALIYDTPSLLRAIGPYSYSVSGGNVVTLIFNNYKLSGTDYAGLLGECEDAVTTLLYGIKDNDALSNAEKCLILHDRLAAWCEYDYANYLNNKIPVVSYCAAGALAKHCAVCQGYSYAYQWMLDELGIVSYYTSSETINHGWNMVYIDGEPYYIDVTWDDPVWDVSGRVLHDNFLQSYSTFSEGHKGAADFSDEAVSTLYEDGFWYIPSQSNLDSINTEIVFINGKFYYLAPAENNTYALMSRDTDGNTETVKSFSYRWNTANNSYYRRNAKMTQYGDKLLYSTPSDIRLYDPAADTETVIYAADLENGVCIYGFTQIDGKLVIETNTSPRFDETTKSGGQIIVEYCTQHTNRELLENKTPTAAGEVKYICTDCRKVFTDKIAAHEHSFGEWTVIAAATCSAVGTKSRTCSVCNAVDTETVEKNTNNHAGGTEIRDTVTATCAAAGYSGDTYCLGCGNIIIQGTATAKDTSKHDYRLVKTVAPTCSAKGYDEYKCSVCSDTYTANETTAAGHTPDGGTVTKSATCTETGVKTYKCSVCGAITGTEVIAKTAHTEKTIGAVEATCSTNGYTGDIICSVCNTEISGGTVTDKKAHTEKVVSGFAPTCTASGLSDGKICSVCDTVIEAQQTLNPTGHSYNTVVTPVTCTTDGFTTHTCQNCSDSYVTDRVSATGHSSDNGTVTKQATCTATGVKTYKCTICGIVLNTETVAKKEHSYQTITTEATCTKAGSKVTKCTVCSYVKSTETIPAKGHTEVISKQAKDPTCSKAGNTVEKKCSACGTVTVASKSIPAYGHIDGNSDGVCDECGSAIAPAVDPKPCSCNCHKTGFMGFIWKITNFFNKIFGKNKICDCGAKHY